MPAALARGHSDWMKASNLASAAPGPAAKAKSTMIPSAATTRLDIALPVVHSTYLCPSVSSRDESRQMRPLSGRLIASLEMPLPRQRTRDDVVEILMTRPPAENPPHLLSSRHDCRRVPG